MARAASTGETTRSKRLHALATMARVALVGVAATINAMKGYEPTVSGMMWPFWAISYRHGFIRRALVGTVFQSLMGGASVDEQREVATTLHRTAWFVLVALIIGWGVRLGRGGSARTRALVFTGTAAVLLSSFVPTVLICPGYFDVYILVLVVVAGFVAWTGRPLAAGLLGAVGPLIHDGFLFLWLAVVLCVLRDVVTSTDRRAAARRSFGIVLPVATAVGAVALHSHAAFARVLSELPTEWRNIAVFEMPLAAALERMRWLFGRHPGNVALAAAMYVPHALLIAGCGLAMAQPRRLPRAIFALMVTFAPCSILLVAWDLSRFLVWSVFGAFVSLCWSVRDVPRTAVPPSRADRRPAAADLVLVALAVLCTGGPSTFAYFDIAYPEYRLGPPWLRRTPAATVTYAWLRIYNREMVTRSLSRNGGCALEGRNTRLDEACSAIVTTESSVETKPLFLAPGRYSAKVEVEPRGECLESVGELAAQFRWRNAPMGESVRFDALATRVVVLDFAIDGEQAAMGQVHVRVGATAGCFRFVSLELSRQ